MSQIVDYAGMYPPTNLPLDEAFNQFRNYHASQNAWMLSRFVIPVKDLFELPEFSEDLSFTALGRGGKNMGEVLENTAIDLAEMLAFRVRRGTYANVDMYEVALPAAALADKFTANDCVTRAADLLNKNGVTVYFEAPFGDGWEERAERLLRALRKVKDKHVGFKLRSGGVTPEAFPTAAQMAWAITEARQAGVPLKCTAGLHHPVRHYNESVQTKMHGFLNVFGAAMLAFAIGMEMEKLQSMLEDEDPAHFTFDAGGFSWNGHRITNSEIVKARLFATSFGSCSFEEPGDDLKVLGLL